MKTYLEVSEAVKKVVPASVQIYLVGGAVRDILLGRPVKDFDFVLEGLVRPVGKKLADLLHGKYYVLDDERDMVRVIFSPGTRNFHCIDLAQINGTTIEEDLFDRDFTINAIAIDFMEKNRIIDPMGGANDLKEKRLRMCNLESLNNDPLRGMRSIRMAIELDLEMDPPLIKALHELSSRLDQSSMERYRDELFKILAVGRPNISVQLLDKYGFLDHLFAEKRHLEISALAEQLRKTEALLKIVAAPFNEAGSSNLVSGLTILKLGKLRDALSHFYEKDDSNLQERKTIVFFTIIASQFGQANTEEKRLDLNGKRLVLSTALIATGKKMLSARRDADNLAKTENLANFDIYKFFRKYGSAGIDGILLSLALDPAVNSPAFEPSLWAEKLDRCALLMDAWFNRQAEVIKPAPLLTGAQISEALDIPEGPKIGEIKDAVMEAQLNNIVTSYAEALEFSRKMV